MKTSIEKLADFVTQISFNDLPLQIVHEAKRVLLDSMGCALSGLDSEKGASSVRVARRLAGPPEASIIGTNYKVSPANAAFANGELINALDFDAILRPAVHVTPWVLPAALALCENSSCSGKDLLLGIIIGHELGNRFAVALGAKNRKTSKDAKPTENLRPAVSGYSYNAFGSAGTSAKTLDLKPAQVASAMAIAGYNAPMQSFTQWERSGTDALIKYGSPGWVAQTGVVAALLAQEGYTGDLSLLDSDYGFWRYSGAEGWDPEALFNNLGSDWQILKVRYKRYPCCGITHSPLDAFTKLIEDNKLNTSEIEQVSVWMDPTSGLPLWQDRQVTNEVQAQFSVAYDFAVAAFGLDANWQWLRPETRHDPKIRSFMERVKVFPHANYYTAAREDPTAQVARVEVKARGEIFVQENRFASGRASPERPAFSDRHLEEKFYYNACARLSDQRIADFIQRLWSIEDTRNVPELMAMLAI